MASRFLENIVAQVEELWEIDSSKLKLNHGQKAPVMDILIWAECYKCTGMAAILSCRFPQKPRELFAYMQIIHATRKYHGPSWVTCTCTYDRMFRRLTTARCSLTGLRSTSWAKRCYIANIASVFSIGLRINPMVPWPPQYCNPIQLLLFQRTAVKFFSQCKHMHTCNICHGLHCEPQLHASSLH